VKHTEKEMPYLESSQDPSMMEKAKSMTFMEVLYQDSVNSRRPSTIYLINGIKLEGYVMGFDHESILYQRDTKSEPFGINRSAVASFLPEGAALSRHNDDPAERQRSRTGASRY
jgi:RNA chaperone Hfq